MIRRARNAARQSWRYSAIVALSATMVACGGSSGTTDTTDGSDDFDFGSDDIGLQDLDGDGIPNQDDSDADGDGLADAGLLDNFVDLDGDGRDDISGLTESEANFDNVDTFQPCGIEDGSVAFGEEPDWAENCTIRRSINGGEFADSLYSAGIQRIVFCTGFGGTAGQDYTDFADGEYGPVSETAVEAFQASTPNPLVDDGIVGPATWAKLLDTLELLDEGLLSPGADSTEDTYGFLNGPCEDIPLFYQTVNFDEPSNTFTLGGWRLARNVPFADESVPFSIEEPFGRL